MNRKSIYLLICFMIFCGSSWWLIRQKGKAEAKVRVTTCMANLRCIGQAINRYRELNSGKYPPSLQDLYPAYLADRRNLRCPADFSAASTNADGMSYLYFRPDGSITATQIIVRDNPGNHQGLHGYAILYANGESEWLTESLVQGTVSRE